MTRAEHTPGIQRLHVDKARMVGHIHPAYRICSGCPHAMENSNCELETNGGTCSAGPEYVWYAEHIFIANKITGIGRR